MRFDQFSSEPPGPAIPGHAMVFGPVPPGRSSLAPGGPLARHPPGAADTRPVHPDEAVKRKVRATRPARAIDELPLHAASDLLNVGGANAHSQHRSLVTVLENLHRSDEMSLRLVAFPRRRVSAWPPDPGR
jgi:hypothetical protein